MIKGVRMSEGSYHVQKVLDKIDASNRVGLGYWGAMEHLWNAFHCSPTPKIKNKL